jgi:hypothetical protein
MAETPETRAAKFVAARDAEIKRLQRIPLLGAEVIHANNWRERTVERCRRLLMIAQPDRTEGLAAFFHLFEEIYGKDKLPLKWMLGTCVYPRLNPDDTESKKERDFARAMYNAPILRSYGESAVAGFGVEPSYTDGEEQRRIAILRNEQKAIEAVHAELYRAAQGEEPTVYFCEGMAVLFAAPVSPGKSPVAAKPEPSPSVPGSMPQKPKQGDNVTVGGKTYRYVEAHEETARTQACAAGWRSDSGSLVCETTQTTINEAWQDAV